MGRICGLGWGRFEGQISGENVEIGVVSSDRVFKYASLFFTLLTMSVYVCGICCDASYSQIIGM